MAITLSTPRLTIVLGDPERPESWEQLEVQTIGRDIQAAEELLGKLKRGTFGDNPITAQTMLAYFAARRSGLIPAGTTWPEFQELYLEVKQAETSEPGPTDSAAGPESS